MPSERFTGLAAVLAAIRTEEGITQPVLTERVGLGRSVVAQRVGELEAAGLVAPDGLGPSTGGRAPRRLRLQAEAGYVLGIDIATNELAVGVTDLAGNLLLRRQEVIDLADGPDVVFGVVERLGDALLDETGAQENLWSVGVGMPGPVAHDDDGTTTLPTMPDWDQHPTRERLAARWRASVWMDNRVNLSALGERRANPLAGASQHMLYLGGGFAIGAAVIVDGRIYRGSNGLAGAIGHSAVPETGDAICACGNVGCLEAVAGGAALARNGRILAETRQSPLLASTLAETGTIRPADITHAANKGDPAARALLQRTALLLGGSLATLVSVFNPDLVIIGGGIARARAHVLAAIREEIYRRSLPAATQDLRIEPAAVDMEVAGVTGAVQFALDELFSRDKLPLWLDQRSPAGRPGIALPQQSLSA